MRRSLGLVGRRWWSEVEWWEGGIFEDLIDFLIFCLV